MTIKHRTIGANAILIIIGLFISHHGMSCSVFKITKNGKTIVGNNEDFYNPSTKIWFTPKDEHQKYGVAHVGFDNMFSQGAFNSEGLVFDGFAMPYLAVNDTAGKLTVPNTEYLPYIMGNFSNVREVRDYFKTINLHHLTTSMYLFVDKTGEYLIVEGDSLIIGNDPVFMLSNFYPSQTPSQDEVKIPFFNKGKDYINNNDLKADFETCSNVMSSLQQGFTQYSSIYDLSNGSIKIHHFHNYDDAITLSLRDELLQGAHEHIIPELFSKESEGYKYYYDYNFDAEAITKRIGDEWNLVQDKVDPQTLQMIALEAENMLNTIGYAWLKRGQLEGAIAIFSFNVKLFPEAPNTYDSLAEAYMKNEQYDLAIAYYKKAIKLNKKNNAAKETMKKLKKLKKKSDSKELNSQSKSNK